MANICFTKYVVKGEMTELKDLYAKMIALENGTAPVVNQEVERTWMGNLVNLLGGDWNNFECRGDFYDVSLNEEKGELRYSVDSSWQELADVREFIGECYPSLTIYFRAEEGGCGIYETNDIGGKYFERHKLSYNNIDFERIENYFFTFQEVLDEASRLFDEKICSREEMQRLFDEYNEESEADICYNYFEEPSPSFF